MARRREPSAFALVLGTLLAHGTGIEALAPQQSRHIHSRGGLPERSDQRTLRAPELARCDRADSAGGVVVPSVVLDIAASLRGGRSIKRSGAGKKEKEDAERDPDGHGVATEGAYEAGVDEQGEEQEDEQVLYDERAVEWMMQQLCMYQTRTALISQPLAAKGYKLRGIVPSPRGLVCAMSTEERRMDCRMYVEAEVGKKVVAPCKCKGTQKWISFSALNSERRKDAAKWKNCPTCQGPIDYKLYEAYGGGLGKAVSAVLNNAGATRAALGVFAGIVFLIVSPVLHAAIVRVLTSGLLWKNYHRISMIINLPLPLQIMGIRLVMSWTYQKLLALELVVRQSLTDMESQLLESTLPVTIQVDDDGEEVPVPHRKL